MSNINKAAEILDEALLKALEVPPLTTTLGEITLAQSYEIQELGQKKRLSRGEKIIGYKMGFTSKAKMEQMGLHSPINGYLTNKMQLHDGDSLNFEEQIHPKGEPEAVFVLKKSLRGKISRKEAIDACEGITVGLEILDSRFTGFKYFSLSDVVADNCSSSKFIIGKLKPLAGLDLENLKMGLEVNGKVVHEALSSAILGNPLESLMALSEMADERNFELPQGSIILAGAATQAVALEKEMTVSAVIEGIGKVSLNG